ncbi:hypothetical protein B0H19DRAFT_1248339 [Mycena capillaripes]|nr:hypothetical protein B0H19DRAFT_1248339 [Mycena capillaripes]
MATFPVPPPFLEEYTQYNITFDTNFPEPELSNALRIVKKEIYGDRDLNKDRFDLNELLDAVETARDALWVFRVPDDLSLCFLLSSTGDDNLRKTLSANGFPATTVLSALFSSSFPEKDGVLHDLGMLARIRPSSPHFSTARTQPRAPAALEIGVLLRCDALPQLRPQLPHAAAEAAFDGPSSTVQLADPQAHWGCRADAGRAARGGEDSDGRIRFFDLCRLRVAVRLSRFLYTPRGLYSLQQTTPNP